jgi:hypothetical protein
MGVSANPAAARKGRSRHRLRLACRRLGSSIIKIASPKKHLSLDSEAGPGSTSPSGVLGCGEGHELEFCSEGPSLRLSCHFRRSRSPCHSLDASRQPAADAGRIPCTCRRQSIAWPLLEGDSELARLQAATGMQDQAAELIAQAAELKFQALLMQMKEAAHTTDMPVARAAFFWRALMKSQHDRIHRPGALSGISDDSRTRH